MILLHISDTIESPTQNSRTFNHMIHDRTESERAPKDRKSRLPLLYRSPQRLPLLYWSPQKPALRSESARIITYLKPKGIIFLGGYIDAFRHDFSQIHLPCVLVTNNARDFGFDNLSSFTPDYFDAGKYVVDRLLSEGHTRIGILGGYPEGPGREYKNGKILGAVEALRENGILFDFDRDYEPCSYSAESGYKALEILFRRSPDLTAVFALSDSIAFGTIRALKDIGLRVPEDVSVIGFDGLTYANYSIPRLSTIRQDTAGLAKKSVDDLLMRLSYGGEAVHELVPYEYIEGESVAVNRKS